MEREVVRVRERERQENGKEKTEKADSVVSWRGAVWFVEVIHKGFGALVLCL